MNNLIDWDANARAESEGLTGIQEVGEGGNPEDITTVILDDFPNFRQPTDLEKRISTHPSCSDPSVIFSRAKTLIVTKRAARKLLSCSHSGAATYIDYIHLLSRPKQICIDLSDFCDLTFGRWDIHCPAYKARQILGKLFIRWDLDTVTWHGARLPAYIPGSTGPQRYFLKSLDIKNTFEVTGCIARTVDDVMKLDGQTKEWRIAVGGVDSVHLARAFFGMQKETVERGESDFRVDFVDQRVGEWCQCCGAA